MAPSNTTTMPSVTKKALGPCTPCFGMGPIIRAGFGVVCHNPQVSKHKYIPVRSSKIGLQVEVVRTVASVRSDFQTIEVLETETLGRVLTLDGHVQLSEMDEHAYHESLVHIPALSCENLRTALVVGGGDGGVLRELCRYETLERVDMVEIDEVVVHVSREHMPSVSAGAFDDPRVRLHIADAFGFVRDCREQYDLIVVDCTDVYEEEDGALSEDLFTDAFYDDLKRILSPGGFVVSQADNLVFCPYSTRGAMEKFSSVFPVAGSYWCLVPSFGGFSGFVWGSNGQKVSSEFAEAHSPTGLRYLNRLSYDLALSPVPFLSLAKDD